MYSKFGRLTTSKKWIFGKWLWWITQQASNFSCGSWIFVKKKLCGLPFKRIQNISAEKVEEKALLIPKLAVHPLTRVRTFISLTPLYVRLKRRTIYRTYKLFSLLVVNSLVAVPKRHASSRDVIYIAEICICSDYWAHKSFNLSLPYRKWNFMS